MFGGKREREDRRNAEAPRARRANLSDRSVRDRVTGKSCWGRCAAAVTVTSAAFLSSLLAGTVGASAAESTQPVIVLSNGAVDAAGAAQAVGGSVLRSFRDLGAAEVSITRAGLASLANSPDVTTIPDLPITLQGGPVASTSPHTPSAVFSQETGADQLAQSGDTGQGVTVAVLDTGIANLPDFSGRLVGGVDLTGEGNPFSDGFGHGTFVAGLVAGNGASSGGQYHGEAPSANLASVKVAGVSGTTTLGRVIAGVEWTIQHKDQYNIKVLNMSIGFQSLTSTLRNPLDRAVEAAWNAGIAVVASAGNAGPFNGTILSPGDDPLVITVGALDDMATPSVSDDTMTDFSSVGPTAADGWVKPDLVTSGRSVISVAAPGSTVYNLFPSARIGSGNFKGSGTSFSAAVTSGAAALVFADNPGITPNQLKARLLGNAGRGPVGNPFVDGHGALDAYAAATSAPMDLRQSTDDLRPTRPGSTVSLAPTGSVDTWNPAIWSGAAWNGAAWNGAAWNGAAWNGAAWNGFTWSGAAWNGAAWNGAAWNGAAWNGAAWNGAAWNGSSWTGAAWNASALSGVTVGPDGAAWNGAAWNGAAWNGAAWKGAAWNGAAWNGAAWNGAAWNGAAWSGAAWNGAAWNGAAWNGAAWNGAAWNGAAWNGAAWNGAAWNASSWS
jgi:serine protease AprX